MRHEAQSPGVCGAVAVCVAFCVTAASAYAENTSDVVVPQSAPTNVVTVDLNLGPFPNRRGLAPEAEVAAASSLDQAIEQCIEEDMQAVGAPGAAATVMLDGVAIFERGFGYKRWGYPDLVDSDTRFRIGSATKMFTAAAVMQQLEAGLVDLNQPVTDFIPELRLSGQWSADIITIRHLLTHSSAMPDYFEDPLGLVGDAALGEWAGSLGEVQLHAPPGAFWNYSNPGFSLAGLVAERASGIPFRELVHTRIFDAAGMSASTFDPGVVMASGNYSYGHPMPSSGDETVYAPDSFDSWVGAPAGQAFSTASDLARWAQLLMDGGGAVLSSGSTEAMQRRQIYLEYVPDSHYGLGIFAENYKGFDVRQHGGNIVGWGAMLLWVPEERFVVSILGNTLLHLTAAAYCIVDAVLEPAPAPPPDYSTDPTTWTHYEGLYSFMDNKGDPFEAEVRMREDGFFITFIDPGEPGSYETGLVQLHLDTFIIDLDGDGILDPLFDLTFIPRGGSGGPTRWLRNRSFVGQRQIPPRRPGARRAPGRLRQL